MKWIIAINGQEVVVDNPAPADRGKFLNFMRKNSRKFNDIMEKS